MMRLTAEQRTAIFEALGSASMCWGTPSRNQVFDSERAQAIGRELIAKLQEEPDKPLCASTYKDQWGHVWECEKPWGHGPSREHMATIPPGWQSSMMAPYIYWSTSQAIK